MEVAIALYKEGADINILDANGKRPDQLFHTEEMAKDFKDEVKIIKLKKLLERVNELAGNEE
jgi:hypothetical protein